MMLKKIAKYPLHLIAAIPAGALGLFIFGMLVSINALLIVLGLPFAFVRDGLSGFSSEHTAYMFDIISKSLQAVAISAAPSLIVYSIIEERFSVASRVRTNLPSVSKANLTRTAARQLQAQKPHKVLPSQPYIGNNTNNFSQLQRMKARQLQGHAAELARLERFDNGIDKLKDILKEPELFVINDGPLYRVLRYYLDHEHINQAGYAKHEARGLARYVLRDETICKIVRYFRDDAFEDMLNIKLNDGDKTSPLLEQKDIPRFEGESRWLIEVLEERIAQHKRVLQGGADDRIDVPSSEFKSPR